MATAISAAEAEGLGVEVTVPSGRRRRIALRAAIDGGIVAMTAGGRVIPTFAGAAAGAQVIGGTRVIRRSRRGGRGYDSATAPPDSNDPARTLAMNDGATSPAPASQQLGNIASAAMLARGLLRIAEGPGLPAWQTVYYAANGINRYTGHKFLPEWMQRGPVKIGLDAAILAPMLRDSWKALPGARAHLKASGSWLSHMPAEAAAVASTAAAGAKANVPAISKLFPLIKPLYTIGLSASSIAGIMALPEYLREHGTHGLLTTTSGRGAWIGALSGAAMLGSMFIPASPLQLYTDFASNVLWLTETINGYGWFDSILGGDKSARESRAARSAMRPGSATSQAAAGAVTISAQRRKTAQSLASLTLARSSLGSAATGS